MVMVMIMVRVGVGVGVRVGVRVRWLLSRCASPGFPSGTSLSCWISLLVCSVALTSCPFSMPPFFDLARIEATEPRVPEIAKCDS